MKLKCILLFILSLGLCGCPGNDQVFFEIQSINVNNVIAETGEKLADSSSIEWNLFAINLTFNSSELIVMNRLCNKANIAMATRYISPEASFKITNLTIEYNNNSNTIDLTNIFSTYEYKVPCPNTIACLNDFASEQFDGSAGKDYLKFENKPDYDLSDGFFTVSLELEDGTILKDSTQTITITP